MALKIINFIFVVSLAFGITSSSKVKAPFDVNEVINQVSNYYPSTPEPTDYDKFLVDTSIFYASAPNGQYFPAFAFDGINYFVVWQDDRGGSGVSDIYGTRVTPDGIVLDEGGIPISTAVNDQMYPSVAYNGSNFLVVWEDLRSSSAHIYGARVTQNGQVLDTNNISISNTTSVQGHPSVSRIDTNYLVVWHEGSSHAWDIYGTRVTLDGTVLDTTSIPISTATDEQLTPSVAFDGSNCLVVWSDGRTGTPNIFGARVAPDGSVLDDTGFAIVTTANFNSQYPSVTFGDINYLVVWQDGRNFQSEWDIYGARITRAGNVLDPNGIQIFASANGQRYPSVAFDSTNYLVVWQDARTGHYWSIYAARVNQAGTVLDTTGFPVSTSTSGQFIPSVAFDGVDYLVTWEGGNYRSSICDIFGARVNQSGVVLDSTGIIISTAGNSQYYPSVAFDSTNYLVVWQDNRSGKYGIYGERIDQNGTILDSTTITISKDTVNLYRPSVTFGGSNYFVVWQTRDYNPLHGTCDIYGARISTDGTVLDSNNIPVSIDYSWQINPSVAFDGTNYFAVWCDHRNDRPDIYGARVAQDGTVLDPHGIAISLILNPKDCPAIAFDGTNYLVVWQDQMNLYGTRVTPSGTVLDPTGITITIAYEKQCAPAIAFDGTNYLVVWQDKRNGNFDIYGTRVTPAGTVLNPSGIPISTAPFNQTDPAIVFDGTNYLVVFSDERSQTYNDLYGALVSPAGVVIDSFAVETGTGHQNNPALVGGNGNQILITYSGWTDNINSHTANTMRIWGMFYPFTGGIEEENTKVKIPSAKLLEVYPNPAKAFLAVLLPQTADRQIIKMFDVSGKIIREIASATLRFASQSIGTRSALRNDDLVKISLKGINPGIYFLKVGKETKKFIVAK